ncbi:MAG: Glycerol-3-phosphate dehydrogenase [NAD(P)+] [Eubacteriales bacterium SKADARSKE-1]|nr:Glycerol-3-phosphate dehydrogenase [NAD(P)+] [Eubacteriales bacterium SKADARSKE-1]
MNVSVLGCGRWGSFIAWYLNSIGHKVVLWGRENSKSLNQLIKYKKNDLITFNENVKFTSDLDLAISHAETIIISISCQSLDDFSKQLIKYDLSDRNIVLCMKGIEETSTKRLTQVVETYIGESLPIAIWVGPGQPSDFVKGIPNCMVIDSKNTSLKKHLVQSFSNDLIKLYIGVDLIGNEIGAAAKNVIGIAAGLLDGIGYSSLKGVLMSKGAKEVSDLISAMGGNRLSAYGLCHLGDYQATLFSEYSHNRKFGELLAQGEKFTKLAEGVSSSSALAKLSQKYNVEMPICSATNFIVNNGGNVKDILNGLFI